MEFDNENRIVTSGEIHGDNEIEYSLRPKLLDDYVGQTKAKENLKVFMEAAKKKERVIGPCFALRTSGTRKNYSCNNYCK